MSDSFSFLPLSEPYSLLAPPPRRPQFNELTVLICGSFLFASVACSLPLTAGGLPPLDALFEAVSGITTTGLSMITDWEGTTSTTFFARALTQWVGGLGILVFCFALMAGQGDLTFKFGRAQEVKDDSLGGISHHLKGIITIYSAITLAGILALWIARLSFFDAVLFSFCAVSTGGFSHLPDSIMSLSVLQQGLLILLSILCAVSLPFYFRLWRHRLQMTQQGLQAIGLILCALLLFQSLGYHYSSLITAFSSQTSAGFTSIDLTQLTPSQTLLMVMSMIIGGGVGSTAGGLKILRLILFVMFVHTHIVRQSQSSHTYYQPRLAGKPVSDRQMGQATGVVALYIVLLAFSWLAFLLAGYPAMDSLFEVASALGTTGLSSGLTGPDLPSSLKVVLMVDMLAGRLEILPWLLIAYPRTWIGDRNETHF